jgi:gliding motility-associated-like protein
MNRFKFLLAAFLLPIIPQLNAQMNTFRASFDIGSFDITGGMVETPAKEYVIAGLNNSFITYYGDAMKIDSAGTVIWAKTYNSGFATNFTDIKNVSTGGYIVTGSSTSGGGGALLIRLDNNGNVLWASKYQLPNIGVGNTSSEYGNAVIETSDGGFLVGGGVDYFWDGASVTTVDTSSAFGFKTNSTGTLLWSKVWVIPTANPDEHYINDVAESADGYFFVGQSSEGSGTLSSNGDYPSNALLIKTTTAGALTYIRRWGAGNANSEGINSAIKLNTGANSGKILLGGFDDINAPLITVEGTGATPTMGAFNRRINGAAFPPRQLLIQDIMENTDGNYSVIGTQIEPLSFAFYTAIYKINSSSGALIFGRGYAPIGLSSILPEGGLSTNQGYYVSMTDQQAGGFNHNIIRTNHLGQLGSGPAGCNSVNLTPGTAGYSPTLSTPASSNYDLASFTSFIPVVSNITPVKAPDCSNIVCAKPPATVSGTPTTICAGQNATLTATGGGTYAWNTGATTSFIIVSPTNTTAYTATVTNGGCDSIPAPVTINVNPLPSAVINPAATTICTGQMATLTASGGGTYSWNTGVTTSVITPSPTTATNYIVTVTSGSGCTKTAVTSVSLTSPPNATIGGLLTVCSGNTTTLTASGGGTYSWSTGATTSSISPVVTGAATYSVFVSAGSCSNTAAVTVNANALPVAGISGNTNLCQGSSGTLTATGGGTYSWSSGSTNTTITVNPTTGTTYTVAVTNGNGCTDTATTTVNVLPPPTASVSGNSTICSGQTTTLTASGGATYSWNTGATTSSVSVSPTTGTTYSVIVSSGSCSDTTSIAISVNPSPNANINTASTSICAGQSATLTATGGGTYSWNTGVTTNPIIVSPTTSTSYSVIVSNGSCTSTTTVNLTVNSPVTAGVTSTSTTICSGTSATLTASGGGTYSWSTGVTSNPVIVSPSAGTTYSVIVSNGSCADTASVNISVNTSPTASVSATSSSICAGQTATLTATGGGTYAWNTGATANTISVAPTVNASYSVTVTSANGCTALATTSVTVTPMPVATVNANSTICSGDVMQLTASGGTTYVWNPGGQTTSSVLVNPGTTTNYTVTVTNGNCMDTASTTVFVNPSPTAVAGSNIVINYGSTTTLTGSGGGNYSWSNGETTANIVVQPPVTTTYTLVVTDANGCTDIALVTVTVEFNCGEIFYPSAFSPNNDTHNDFFRPRSPCLKAMDLIIYDRWGVKVYQDVDINSKGWDGMYNGEIGNTAVFGYYFSYILVNGDSGFKKGTVTLIR